MSEEALDTIVELYRYVGDPLRKTLGETCEAKQKDIDERFEAVMQEVGLNDVLHHLQTYASHSPNKFLCA